MDLATFTSLVSFLALVYAFSSRFIQNKLMDKAEMEAIQRESRELSLEMDKANKAKDKKKMDEVLQRQMDFMPRMNKMMMNSFKPMFVILIIFALLSGLMGQIDPTTKDDIKLDLRDDGKGCDVLAGDGTYSACYALDKPNTNFGKWTILVKAFEGGTELSKNESYFSYGENDDTYVETGIGNPMKVWTDKPAYQPGEDAHIFAEPANMTNGASLLFIPLGGPRPTNVTSVTATLSNGTYFNVDLPITIPILGIKRFYQPITWLIVVSLVANLALSVVMSQYDRWKKAQMTQVNKDEAKNKVDAKNE